MRVLCSAIALLAACAWDEGEHFAVLDARIDAHYEAPAERDAGDGWQRLNNDYQVKLARLILETEDITLFDSGRAGTSFDPANPPPGFSLCHNGHCHAADGSLVSYEEIERLLAGGEGATPIIALEPPVLELVAGVQADLACEPECGLPLATISLATMPVTGVRAEGLIRDSREPARLDGEVAWSADIALDEASEVALAAALELPADRGHDPDVSLVLALHVTGALFDDIDWDALPAVDGALVVEGTTAEAIMLTNLGEYSLEAEVTR